MHGLQLGMDNEHHDLMPISTPIETAHDAHVLKVCMVITMENVDVNVGSCGKSRFGK